MKTKKRIKKIKAVIFDLDNLLIKSYPDHYKSFFIVARRYGYKIKKKDVYKKFGISAKELIKEILPNLSKEEIDRFVIEKEITYRNILRKKGVILFPFVKNLLDFLKNKEIKMIISSSASEKNIKIALEKSILKNYFNDFVAAEHTKKHKPHSEPLLKAAKILRIKPNYCAYIGDSIYEMIAAKRAKMLALAVLTGFYSNKELKRFGADFVFNDFKELKIFFERNL
ncbi:MAG: HAD family hydrolase [Candidatus Pacearchaeota archaeon]